MVRCQHRERVRADLVRRVAVRRDAVGAGDDAVHLTRRHQRRGGGVGDHGVRDPGRLELPGRQPRALQQRAGLVDPHVREQVTLPGGAERADGAAVATRREPARIAVRQGPRARAEQLGRVHGHRAAAFDLVFVQPAGVRRRGVVPHLRQRPGEVDRSGPRAGERGRGGVDVLAALRGQHEPVGSGDPDRRRAANREPADRGHELGDRRALELDLFVGQPALVEEDDLRAVLLVPNDVLGV